MVALPGSSLFTVSTGASSSRTKDCSSCCNSAHCSGGKHWLCRTASRTADRAQARTGWMRACVCASGQEAWASSATNHANARLDGGGAQLREHLAQLCRPLLRVRLLPACGPVQRQGGQEAAGEAGHRGAPGEGLVWVGGRVGGDGDDDEEGQPHPL